MTQITFVCTGNTCRSPMAEGIFKKLLKERNIEFIKCRSCGLNADSGDKANYYAVNTCYNAGIDISNHRATQINKDIIDESDIIVCMTQYHKNQLLPFAPSAKIMVPDKEISDPYGRGEAVYFDCADKLYDYCVRLLDSLLSEITVMSCDELSQIALIERECFSSPWTEKALKEELSNPTAHFLVCKYKNKVLGYIGVNEVCDEAYIDNLAVSGDYRRMYIGENLLKQAQNDAFLRGCSFITLEVRKSNRNAVALYKKLGYNTVGERKNFYTNPSEDALIMTLYKDDINENTGS